MYVVEPDERVITKIADQINRHRKNMGYPGLQRWEWEEINRRGWRVEIDGKTIHVVLDPAELTLALDIRRMVS